MALAEGYVEVYRRPSPDGYGEMRRYARGETIAGMSVAELGTVAVGDILGDAA